MAPWDEVASPDTEGSSTLLLGAPVRRLEDLNLIKGAGTYVGDLITEDTLHCAFVRSPLAHGEFAPPDLEEVIDMPGVVAAFRNDTLGLADLPSSPGRGAPEAVGMGQPALARDQVRHVGEPIAVVVAETPAQAVDAAETIWVDIEPLPVVTSAFHALRDEVLLFPDVGSNLVNRETVASDGSGPEVEVEASTEVSIPRLSPVSIEPLAFLAVPHGDGLEVWCGHQSPGRLPLQLGTALGIPPSSIRVRVPDVGGAFGTKGQYYVEYPVVAAIALRLGRRVVWIQSRREQLLSGTHGRGQHIGITVGGDRDGKMRSVRMDILADVGAYPSTGSRIPLFTQYLSQGLYALDHLETTATSAVTNRAPTGPYRGAGRPEAAIAVERGVDVFAAAVGLAPEEVRRRSYIAQEDLPYTTHTGAIYDSGDYRAALDLALELAEVDRWRAEKEARRNSSGNPIGVGIGTFVERAGGIGIGEYGKVELNADGSVTVRTGSTSAGQSHRTVWAQIAASVFSVPIEDIRFYAGDTFEVEQSVGSFASRSAQLGGSAVYRTAVEVRAAARKVAAQVLEAADVDLELVDGRFRVVGSPGSEISLAEVAGKAAELGIGLVAEEMFDPGAETFPYGAYVAVVEVDLETGKVDLLKLVAVDDCGNLINPMVVEGQLHGSIMQGIGQALLEEVVYDDDGQPMTSTLMSYLIPAATQPMPLQTRRLVHPAPSNPLGAKGAGEAGCIGAPPAILNAVHDALRDYGVDGLGFPLTPGNVWQALHDAERRASGHDL